MSPWLQATKPTNVVVVPPSTNVKLTPPPPKKPSQRNCLFINSPDAVISIQSENGTDVTGEIAFNGENYVYKQKDGDERVISNEGLQAICRAPSFACQATTSGSESKQEMVG